MAARLSRRTARRPLRSESVAGAANGVDQSRIEVIVDFTSKPPHEHLEHVRERVVVLVPHMRGDRGAVDHDAGMRDEKFQQRELLRREPNGRSLSRHGARREIDAQIRDLMLAGCDRRPAPREGPNARDELPKGEWLDEVIVSSRFEPAHAIIDRIAIRAE